MIQLIILLLLRVWIKMARRQTLADPKNRTWKYILLLQDGGAYFGDTVWKLLTEIITHRWFHWKRGDGWMD